jgi:hypothetical protein
MYIYFFVYILFIGVLYPTLLNKNILRLKIYTRVFFYFFIFLLIFLATFRIDTGTDYHSYFNFWKHVEPFGNGKEWGYNFFEPGIRFIASVLKNFSYNFSIFLFFTSFTSITIYAYVVKQYKLNYILALFLYFLVFYLAYVYNMMQQSIIMSFFLLLLLKYKFNKKEFFKILFITFVLTLIHKSALLILFYYLTYLIIKSLQIKLLIILTFVLPIVLVKSGIVNYLLSPFSIYIDCYLTNGAFARQTILFELMTRIVLLIIMSFFAIQLKNNLSFQKLFRIYVIGIFFYFILFDYNMLATRISVFSRIVEPLLYSIVILKSKNLLTRNIVLFIVLVLYSYQFFTLTSNPDFYYKLKLF